MARYRMVSLVQIQPPTYIKKEVYASGLSSLSDKEVFVGSNPTSSTTNNGNWRSLVAHLLWEQRVVGSNPTLPTKLTECNESLVIVPPWMRVYAGSNPVAPTKLNS
jgi:hypothetical protein